ncbi:NAD-dependent epimerase/dehydratase family protein [Enterococcus hulanensis]|uniref:NAD-dependent epimerase/dehydratase family protein n=1 Tax=Enterococcus hulanensis TaxID=2559929 RepID=UPI00288CC797|nr:NAD-dependent epimerase/dehydratase family protein [Enterococcus hulanensis]MDT2660061.1 NAD-dependent epimerase/dehydratase family protein [Enterococcus hulanensis]
MKIAIFGAAGFIGTNLTFRLLNQNEDIELKLYDKKTDFFQKEILDNKKVEVIECDFNYLNDFDTLVEGQDMIFHLISTTVPTTSNQHISDELMNNVVTTSRLIESCVKNKIGKFIFLSSGGTVYGSDCICPIKEEDSTNPITAYGIQKLTIEKLLYLYRAMYGLDYKVIRLANPYGPYQKPNGVLGAVTTFTYKAISGENIELYGDGSVIRDFIYIDDAIKGILNISFDCSDVHTFNLGSGKGTSIKDLIQKIDDSLRIDLKITYHPKRKVDVPVNYLDVSRYETLYGPVQSVTLEEGIVKTADYLKNILRKVLSKSD